MFELRLGCRFLAWWCLLAVASTALAQPVIKQGGEFQVNQHTLLNQYDPAIAVDADGDFVVTWTSNQQVGNGIFAARFDSAGMILGTEFAVNTYITGAQEASSVAMESNGDFVVVWHSFSQLALSTYTVFGQRFTSAGVAVSTEFQVNNSTHYSFRPRVASDSDGDFVVVWQSLSRDPNSAVYARRFNSSGAALGDEFRVNSYTPNAQRYPAIAMDADGDFVVAWDTFQDGSGYGIFAKRFNSAGAALGSEFQVHSYTTLNQNLPTIAAEADGDFVVAWQSLHQDGPTGNVGNYGIFARRFDSAGVGQAVEFQVNVFTTNYQRFPDIATDDNGNFVVSWESAAQDGAEEGVFARRVTAAGAAFGPEFQVSTHTLNGQRQPVADFDASGDFVVAWWKEGDLTEVEAAEVVAQRFSLPPLATLDIDGNGALNALTDGLLYLRYRFNLSGTALTASAVGAGCTRCDSATIIAYLNGLGNTLDVDGNMSFSALTDGLLVVRFLFGLGGTTLTNGVVGAGCTRCDAAAIVPYLQMFD